jgi:hypothetical protein
VSYDLSVINQAWFIACEDCMNVVLPEGITNEAMLIRIAEFCCKFATELVTKGAEELKTYQLEQLK